jgi:protein-S-isoprenylcysteine O-methyltransferase Ste14
VSSGAFGYVRHPLYLAAVLFYLGPAVATASLFSTALPVFIFLFYDFIANFEESLLEQRYGEEYRFYKSRTEKWTTVLVLLLFLVSEDGPYAPQ